MPVNDPFESILEAARSGADWAWARLIAEIGGTLTGYSGARAASRWTILSRRRGCTW